MRPSGCQVSPEMICRHLVSSQFIRVRLHMRERILGNRFHAYETSSSFVVRLRTPSIRIRLLFGRPVIRRNAEVVMLS